MEILPELLTAFDSRKRALIKELADFANNPYDKIRQRFAASIEGPNERTRVALEMGRPEDAIYEGIAPDPSGVSGLGKAMFVGTGAKLGPDAWKRLEEAKRLAGVGKTDNEAIRQLTGWFRGPDGKWRTEISDQLADISPAWKADAGLFYKNQDPRTLPEAFEHPDIYKLYPQLRKLQTQAEGTIGTGSFHNDRNLINVGTFSFRHPETERSTFLHEIQHAIQDIEDFDRGGSMYSQRVTQYLEDWKNRIREKFINQGSSMQEMQMLEDKFLSSPSREFSKRQEGYHNLAGEAEARLTEARANLGAKGRMETPLEYDVPKEELIFHNGSTGAQFSVAPKETTDIYRNQLAPYQHQVYDRLILMGTPPEEAIQRTRTLTNLMQVLPSK